MMPDNYLLVGAPESGKTTAIKRTVEQLRSRGYQTGGVYSPEKRPGGERVGFSIVDARTGKSRTLAHVDRETGPVVGKYRVNVDNIDLICSVAFPHALEKADIIVVDEIAPMETYSQEFTEQVRQAFDSELPVLAAVHQRATSGFIQHVKERSDIERFEVTDSTREHLPTTLAQQIHQLVS